MSVVEQWLEVVRELCGVVKHNAVHAHTPAAVDILRFVVDEYAFFGFHIKLLEETAIDGGIGFQQVHVFGQEIALELVEDVEFVHHVIDFGRPVGQAQQAIAAGFEVDHERQHAVGLLGENVGIVLVEGVEGFPIVGPQLFLLLYEIGWFVDATVHLVVHLKREYVFEKPIGLLVAA